MAAIGGHQMAIMYALAMLPMLAIAVGFVKLNMRDPGAGTAYTWAGRYLHPMAGFAAGWLLIGGFTIFTAYSTQALGSTTLQVLSAVKAVNPDYALRTGPAAAIGVLWLAVLSWLAIRGVDVAARMQKVIMIIDVAAVVGLCGFAVIRGGGEPIEWNWFNPFAIGSFSTFVSALVATAYLYWGWDNSLRLNEESRDGSGRSAAKAAMYSLIIAVVVFMFGQVGFQHATTTKELIEQGANGLVFVADRLAGTPGAILAAVALMLSIVAVVQAMILATTRQLLAMSRDRVLGPVWGRLHSRYGTPAAGTTILAVIIAALIGVSVTLGTLAQVIAGALIALGTLCTSYYTICALAVVGAFWREPASFKERITSVYCPLLAALVLGALTLFVLVSNWVTTDSMAFDPSNGRFQDSVALGVAIIGVPVVLIARYVRKSPYFDVRVFALESQNATETIQYGH
jgi:amino acid transporter